MNIGIIGYGVVGRSVHNMLVGHEVVVHDPRLGCSHWDKILLAEVVFICLPTPTVKGEQDLKIVYSMLDLLLEGKYGGLVVIKSTILPSNIRDIVYESYEDLDIMYSPEFLNQYEPYKFQDRHLIGVKNIHQAEKYKSVFGLGGYGKKEVRTTDPVTASMAKYFNNVHGAVKVALMNELFDVCEKERVSYREVLGCVTSVTDNLDLRYTQIAADGFRGFAGFCFPKDIVAFDNEYRGDVTNGAITANCKWRKDSMDKVME